MRISRRQRRNHRTVEKSGGVKLRLVVRRRRHGGELFRSGEEETKKYEHPGGTAEEHVPSAPQETAHEAKAFLMKQVGCGGFKTKEIHFAFKEGRKKSVGASENFNN